MFLSRHRLDNFEFLPCFCCCISNFFCIVMRKRTWTDLHRLCLVFWTKSSEENRTAWSSYCMEPHQTLSVWTFNQPSDVAWKWRWTFNVAGMTVTLKTVKKYWASTNSSVIYHSKRLDENQNYRISYLWMWTTEYCRNTIINDEIKDQNTK